MNEKEKLIKELLNKSQEAFLMAIEIYNKPTIKYRLEGFGFFICNAWELLLKAYMSKEGVDIYYPDKVNRTLSLTDCIKKVFTNDKDPIRINLNIIISLRNTSTHFVIKELDSIYLPFMQANVLNYSQKMFDYFGIDISNEINSSFMTLIINNEGATDEEILSIYGKEIFAKYIKVKNETDDLIMQNSNEKLAININLNVKIVKDKKDAQVTFRIAQEGEDPVQIIKEIRDTNLTHPYRQKGVREIIVSNLKRKGIEVTLNQYNFDLICKKFNLKNDSKYFYKHEMTSSWCCSQALVDFVTNLLIKDNDAIENIKKEQKN